MEDDTVLSFEEEITLISPDHLSFRPEERGKRMPPFYPCSPHDLGIRGERIAQEYLRRQNFRLVELSYRFGRGEIDIIAYEKDVLVFVEVKTRGSSATSSPEEAVTPVKQRQIRRIAEAYLFHRRLEDVKCRFDVLAILFDPGSGEYRIRHYRDAFE